MKKLLLLILLSVLSFSVAALSIEVRELPELYETSDAVVVVQIVSGKLVTNNNGEPCGAVYIGNVSSSYKGIESNTIEFGNYYGFRLGYQYLLFLKKRKAFAMKDNLNFSRAREAGQYQCKGIGAPLQVSDDGFFEGEDQGFRRFDGTFISGQELLEHANYLERE